MQVDVLFELDEPRFYRGEREARFSPQPGGQLPLPPLTHAQKLRQGDTM